MSALTGLGVSFTYLNAWTQTFPSLTALHGYKVVLIFTGNNNSFNSSGFSTSALNRVAEWADSGGRLLTTGQNVAETLDNNTSYSSPSIGRGRLYHGYLGVKYVAGSAYGGAAQPNGERCRADDRLHARPQPRRRRGRQPDVDRGDLADARQRHVSGGSHVDSALPCDRQHGKHAGDAISFGRSSGPTLEEERLEYRYRSVSMGFGLEAVNNGTAFSSRAQVTRATLDWLLDRITFDPVTVTPQKPKKKPKPTKKIVLTAHAASNVGATFTQYRWDFGDGKRYETTATNSVKHKYKKWGTYAVRIEVTDSLGHRAIQHQGHRDQEALNELPGRARQPAGPRPTLLALAVAAVVAGAALLARTAFGRGRRAAVLASLLAAAPIAALPPLLFAALVTHRNSRPRSTRV